MWVKALYAESLIYVCVYLVGLLFILGYSRILGVDTFGFGEFDTFGFSVLFISVVALIEFNKIKNLKILLVSFF